MYQYFLFRLKICLCHLLLCQQPYPHRRSPQHLHLLTILQDFRSSGSGPYFQRQRVQHSREKGNRAVNWSWQERPSCLLVFSPCAEVIGDETDAFVQFLPRQRFPLLWCVCQYYDWIQLVASQLSHEINEKNSNHSVSRRQQAVFPMNYYCRSFIKPGVILISCNYSLAPWL